MLEFYFFCDFLCEHMYRKNDMFNICFLESAKCKMTAQITRTCNVFVNILTLHHILQSTRQCLSSDIFLFSLSNQLILQEVCFLYVQCIQCVQYISNISNFINTFKTFYFCFMFVIVFVQKFFLPPYIQAYRTALNHNNVYQDTTQL